MFVSYVPLISPHIMLNRCFGGKIKYYLCHDDIAVLLDSLKLGEALPTAPTPEGNADEAVKIGDFTKLFMGTSRNWH